MHFIHTADIHLGASPDVGERYKEPRKREIWDTFRRLLRRCEEERVDLLLIAGDLFHRQPLKRELKEVNALFAELSVTQVVLIAGNHDYIGKNSAYREFHWAQNVHPLFSPEMKSVAFPEFDLAVYGFSYDRREITEARYDQAEAPGEYSCEILLVHGGDATHIPMNFGKMQNLGYSYIAMGHIHRPEIFAGVETDLASRHTLSTRWLAGNVMAYAGALEPVDAGDTGEHGYIEGTVDEKGYRVKFCPFACRAYREVTVQVDAEMTLPRVRSELRALTMNGEQNQDFYRIYLTGTKDRGQEFRLEELDESGRILKLEDHTRPDYDFERLAAENRGNLLGEYIASFLDMERDGTSAHDQETPEQKTLERMALYEGVKALRGE
jgi:exonuclease SbcD